MEAVEKKFNEGLSPESERLYKQVVAEEYNIFSGPKGRKIAARIQRHKRHIWFLYIMIGVLMVYSSGLSYFICKLLNGGP